MAAAQQTGCNWGAGHVSEHCPAHPTVLPLHTQAVLPLVLYPPLSDPVVTGLPPEWGVRGSKVGL